MPAAALGLQLSPRPLTLALQLTLSAAALGFQLSAQPVTLVLGLAETPGEILTLSGGRGHQLLQLAAELGLGDLERRLGGGPGGQL